MARNPKKLDLVSIAEIAKMAGTKRQTVTNWRRRSKDMPETVADLKCGPIWLAEDIRQWLVSIGYTHLRR